MVARQTEEIREEYTVSDGSPDKVIVTYMYLGPTPAPAFGDDWDESHDRHIVEVSLVIPNNEYTRLDYLVCTTPHIVRDSSFVFQTTAYDASVMEAFLHCKKMVTEIVEALRAHVARREARLRQRNARLQRGKIGSPFKHVD